MLLFKKDDFVFSCSETKRSWGFVWECVYERERERGQLHNTSFLSPALHFLVDHVKTLNVFFALITRWPPLASLSSSTLVSQRTRPISRDERRVSSAHAHFLFCRNKSKLQVLFLNTCAFRFLSLFCACVNAHLCLRTWIGCAAIETLILL